MSERSLPKLPDDFEIFLEKPYGGLFGDSALAQIIEEVVADPTMNYRPRYLEEMTGRKAPTVREALKQLVKLGLLENLSKESHHPVYRVRVESKKFVALSLLAYAMNDDRDGTDCMDIAILDYYHSYLEDLDKPLVSATASPDMWRLSKKNEIIIKGNMASAGV